MTAHRPEDAALLEAACTDAQEFLLTHPWCHGFGEVLFGAGLGGVVAVFLMSIYPVPTGADEWLWVIVGDLPPAYLVLERSPTPIDALKGYVAMMQDWVDLALDGIQSDEVIPVNLAPTPENATMLQTRLDMLTTTILPWLEAGPSVH
jgi:hypothetical protein